MKKMNVSRRFPALWAGIASVALLFAGCATGTEPDPGPNLAPGGYTVTFDTNGGDIEASPRIIGVSPPSTTAGTLPAEPTRADYAFTGWNTDASGNGSYFTASTLVTKSLTVYAQWQPAGSGPFTVTFDTNGGDTVADPQDIVVTAPSTTVEALPAEPTRVGYAFTRWNTDPEGYGEDFTAYTPVMDDLTVYAQWQLIPEGSFKVTFDKNGGDTEASPKTKIITSWENTVDALPATEPTRAGYAFTGWNTDRDGNGEDFTAYTTVNDNLTVYAQWNHIQYPVSAQYTVSFNSNGGSAVASQTVNHGETAAQPAKPIKEGYGFGGWYKEEGLASQWNFAGDTVTADITLHAKWEDEVLTSVAGLTAYLTRGGGTSAGAPLTVTVGMELSAENWSDILSAIQTAGKYVDLNLAACVKSTHYSGGGLSIYSTFNPNYEVSTGKDRIVSLILPDAADGISGGDYSYSAFKGFTNLKSVSGAKVTRIGSSSYSSAFGGCTGLTSVSFPQIASIGDYAFRSCTGLTSVSFPQATSIGSDAFKGCSGLTSADFPVATSIGNWAFEGCSGLTSADFPKAASIGNYAFKGCSKLTSANFPQATSIGTYAFQSCSSLTSVNIPLAASIGTYTFSGCSKLTSADFPQATSIGTDAFAGCTGLTSVSLPKAAITIDGRAFQNYSKLTSVNLPLATSIGDEAFSGCSGLTSADFPQVASIGGGAFSSCTSLASVSFPAATSTGNNAFYGCTSLSSVSFPQVTSIGNWAFEGCSGLASVSFPKATSIGNKAFKGCTSLSSVSFPQATSIGSSAFYGCSKLTSADFPKATSIGDEAFAGCTGLTSVNIPAATGIGIGAFGSCTGLASVSFPAATSIGSWAFTSCTGLTSVSLPKAASIGQSVFEYTGTAALSITLGSTAPEVGQAMFLGVTATKAVTVKYPTGGSGYGRVLGNTVTNNWANAFRGKGWNGTTYGTGTVNDNITLTYQ